MDESAARSRAADFLGAIGDPAAPVDLDPEQAPLRRAWCYVFFWNARKYLATRHPLDSFAGNGPVVVPLDGSAPFVLPTYAEAEELLDAYERKHGLAR